MKISAKRKIIIISFICLIVIGIGVWLFYFWVEKKNINGEEIKFQEKLSLDVVKANYNDLVKLNDRCILYLKANDNYEMVGTVYGSIEVRLDSEYEIVDEYFKILNSDYYVKYDSVSKIDELKSISGEYKYYKNYIPYNENVVLGSNSKLMVDDYNYYEISGGSYPIIIKDSDYYGIEFNNRLVYVNISDIEDVVSSNNTSEEITDEVSVLNYHFVVSASNENREYDECRQSICITDEDFDNQIKYLSDNNYYSVSMRDLELFIDGKIQLPKKSVSITIDDGWYVARSIKILEKYQKLGTLFLIGNLASPNNYVSEYLEIHSHTWDMHGLDTGDDCPSSKFRGGITCFDRDKVLEDLKKSRESLNNTTYFCYPFYDYNDRAIELLKEAGFTMAFAGNIGTGVRKGQDKFKIPRYIIYNYTSMDTFISYIS